MISRLLLVFVVFFSCSAHAQEAWRAERFEREVPYYRLWIEQNPEFRPPPKSDYDKLNREFTGPREPDIPKVTFYEFDAPNHLQGRVESLTHGVRITLPVEYDHYGYEIRRYMRSVGNMEAFTNSLVIEQELVNIQKTWVIFKHWREKLLGDVDALEAELSQVRGSKAKVRTLLDVNKAIVTAFIVEAQAWISANENFLTFLIENRRDYTFEEGTFFFKKLNDAERFIEIYNARERAKRQIKGYHPFGAMVY